MRVGIDVMRGAGNGRWTSSPWVLGLIAVVSVAGIWYGMREREAQHETLRRMVDSGQEIDQTLMDKLLGTDKHLDRDLWIGGLIVVFIAPGLAMLVWFISLEAEEALWPMVGVAVLVGFVGLGLLVASRFVERSHRDGESMASGRV